MFWSSAVPRTPSAPMSAKLNGTRVDAGRPQRLVGLDQVVLGLVDEADARADDLGELLFEEHAGFVRVRLP